MLQRIQTVYLLLVVVVVIISMFFPYATFINQENIHQLTIFGLKPVDSDLVNLSFSNRFPIYIGVFMVLGTSLASIGFFKNRKRQLLLGKINYLLILISLVFIFLDVDFVSNELLVDDQLPIYGLGTYFLVCTLPLVFLANRAIKKDESLIKSLDRLR